MSAKVIYEMLCFVCFSFIPQPFDESSSSTQPQSPSQYYTRTSQASSPTQPQPPSSYTYQTSSFTQLRITNPTQLLASNPTESQSSGENERKKAHLYGL